MAAITQGQQMTQPARSNKPRPLGGLTILLAPLLRISMPEHRRRRFNAMVNYSIEYHQRAKSAAKLREEIRKESRLYKRIIIERLASMGFSWRPGRAHDNSDERVRKRGKVAKVRIELVRYNEHRICYKLLIRSKRLFRAVSELPYKTYVRELMSDETCEELSFALQRRVRSKRDNPNRGAWLIVYRNEVGGLLPRSVSWRSIIENYPIDDLEMAPFILGIAENNTVLQASFEEYSHMGIFGSTKTGKSNLLNQIVSSLMRFTPAPDLKFIMIDPKQVELAFYENVPHLFMPVVYSVKDALATLRRCNEIIRERTSLMRNARVKKLSDWNAAFPNERMFRLVIVIEELASLWESPKQAAAIHRELEVIANMGRAMGVHLLVCTQVPVKSILPIRIKSNFLLRAAGKTASPVESILAINSGDAAWLEDIPGRMIMAVDTNKKEVQTARIRDEEIEENIAVARGRAGGFVTLHGLKVVMNPARVLQAIVEELEGLLSLKVLTEYLKQYAISAEQIKSLMADVFKAETIQIGRGTYTVEKRGRQYWLKLIAIVEDVDETPKPQPAPPRWPVFKMLPAPPPVLYLPAPREVVPEPPPAPEEPIVLTNVQLVEQFITARCEMSPDSWTSLKQLHAAYSEFVREAGYEALSKHALSKILTAHGWNQRRVGSSGDRGWSGVKLLTIPSDDNSSSVEE